MSLTTELIQDHLRYTEWADARLLTAAGELTQEQLQHDFGTADHSIIGTLAHVFGADRIWLGRLRQPQTVTLLEPHEVDLRYLTAAWPNVIHDWEALAGVWTADDLSVRVEYKTLNGTPYSTPRWQVILHLVNHATHHRGQVAGFLRALGVKPPGLDLVAFYREAELSAHETRGAG